MKANSFFHIPLARGLRPLWAAVVLCLSLTFTHAGNTLYYVNDGSTSNDLFCSAVGSDTHNGLSPATPVASLQTILTRYTLGPSNTVYVDSGTYSSSSNIIIDARHSGSWDYPISIVGVKNMTILSRQAGGSNRACLLNQANHINITGFTFTGADVGLFIDSSLCSYAEIRDNTFCDNAQAGLEVEPVSSSTYYGEFKISHNLLYRTGDGMRLEIQNQISDDQFEVYNNTVVVSNGVALFVGGNLSNSSVYNNILVADGGGVCLETANDYTTLYSDYNTLQAVNGGFVARITYYSTAYMLETLADWQQFTQTAFYSFRDAHSFSRNPEFADVANDDYHLKSSGGRWQPEAGSATGGVWVVDSGVHSPAVDAADIYDGLNELQLEPDPNGGRKNQGCYGGTSQASRTGPGRFILVMAPNQEPAQQSSQPIYWNTTGEGWATNDLLRLDYSLNDGQSWLSITSGMQASLATRQYTWDRPQETLNSTSGCWVRVALQTDMAIHDTVFLPSAAAVSGTFSYYVNDGFRTGDTWCTTTGSDAADGMSPETPAATLQSILDRYTLGPGDTVYVDTGTYLLTNNVFISSRHSGVSDQAVVIKGNPDRTILNRQSNANGARCLVNEANFIDITGFTFCHAEIGLYVNASECGFAKICENTFYSNRVAGLVVEPLTFTTYGMFLIARNLMYDTGDGMRLETQVTDMGDQFHVYNNTVLVTNGAAISIRGNLPGCEVVNNILVAEGDSVCFESADDASTFSSDYNTLWAHNGGAVAEITVTGTTYRVDTLADWQLFTRTTFYSARDTYSFSRDPEFADPAAKDFHLRSSGGRWHPGSDEWIVDSGTTSPCVDTGDPYMHNDNLSLEPAPNGGRMNMGVYGGTPTASKASAGRIVVAMAPDLDQTAQWIYWNTPGSGWVGSDTLRLDYSIDNGQSWQMITNGQGYSSFVGAFEWFRPQESYGSADGCLVRVAFETDIQVSSIVALPDVKAVVQSGAVYYVNNDTLNNDIWCSAVGNSSNDGLSPATPLPTIQDVIELYSPSFGDTIYVDSGTYPLYATLELPDSGAPGGGSENGWFNLIGANRKTILTCQTSSIGSCVLINQDFTHIEGFLIHGGDTGITVNPQSCRNANIINNTFMGQTSKSIHILPDPQNDGFDTYAVKNNILYGSGMNLQSGNGYHLGGFDVINNTVVVYNGTGISCGGRAGATRLINNIVSAKSQSCCLKITEPGVLDKSDYNNFYAYGGAMAVCNVTASGTSYWLTLTQWQTVSGFDGRSFNRDPLFVAPYSSDFHLRSQGGSWHNGSWAADSVTSPCIDAGDPGYAVEMEPADNGNRINIGAYGGTVEASRSSPKRTLLLNSPRGGETWEGQVPIKWEALGTGWAQNDSVRIEAGYSDGTWTVLSGASSLSRTGSFTWVVADLPYSEASLRLRVVCNQNDIVYDITDGNIIVKRLKNLYYVNDSSTEGDWYCTAPGASVNSGKAPDQPLPSLADVLSRYTLGAGDTVYIDQGLYLLTNDTVIASIHKGSANEPILIQGAGDGSVLMRVPDAGGGDTTSSLYIFADYIRIKNITCLKGDIGISVDASSSRHADLVGNSCLSNAVAGIRIEPRANIAGEQYQILQNVVSGQGTGLDLQGSTDLYEGRTIFVIENNTITCAQDGICVLNTSRKQRLVNLIKNNLIHTTQPEHSCIVTLQGGLHYSDFNNLYAVPGAWVGAWQITLSTRQYFPDLSTWQSANGQEMHSLSVNSQFVSPETGNYRVQPNSPCVDAGVNSFWMFDAVDRDGLPRITGKSADIGAYELNMSSSVRLFLEGPFLAGSNSMSCALSNSQNLPQTSPYTDDRRSSGSIPDSVTDWVLVQFRRLADGPAVYSRSAFLRADGWLVNDDGTPGLEIDLPPNEAYYIVVKHRNHLAAMSAEPVPFSGQALDYDFTSNPAAYYGGSNGCVTITNSEGTFYALRAGDADGDGVIRSVDLSICQSQTNSVGYYRGDTDCDGTVTSSDETRILENLASLSVVPRPETILQPALLISPARRTLTAGESIPLINYSVSAADNTATQSDGTIPLNLPVDTSSYWAFARNNSGGTLETMDPDGAIYTAGEVTGRTDIVESWCNDNRLGRAYLNVISTQSLASAGKALIVAGRKSAEDTLWPTTDYLADNAYSTLRYRGFSKENLLYLNPEPDQDVDGNGLLDDIDAEATLQATADAITNGLAGADQVFIYLVDHGGNSSGNGYFRLNSGETVTAEQLDIWLDSLQDTYSMKVTVLLDFCYAGSFLNELTYGGTAPRIVVAACNDSQPSYFVAGGLVSFSGAFFSGVLLGYDVMQSFTLAQSAMSTYQAAQLDDDGDGTYSTNDWAVATETYIGPTFVADGDTPQIGEVCGNQVLSDETAATLWIGSVTALHPISQAWCLVVPPGHNPNPDNPVTDLPQLDLIYDSTSGRYGITYDGFTAAGSYQIQFYAQDEAGNVSAPRQAYVTQIGYNDRVIFVAGGDTNSTAWPAVNYLTHLAYSTFRLRLFTPDHIYLLSPDTEQDFDGDGTNDISAATSVSALQDALEWATSNTTDRLTLYLMGQGTGNTFMLNESECLTTNQLATWLQAYQATNPIPITVILDYSGAGAFIPALAFEQEDDDSGASRIVIASAHAGREALLANGGTVSFSQYLLSGVISGETLGGAYTDARRAIRRVSGSVRQRAQIDDNGNGIASEKNIDGLLAAETTLGSAFITGADSPEIGEVIPITTLEAPGTPLTIWAANVAGMNEISNVWCVITTSGSLETGTLPTLDLVWNSAANRYEAELTDPLPAGTTILTFYAQDILGEISDPVQSELLLADAFEPDNTAATAALYDGRPQLHNFHVEDDTDWARVYLVTNFIYDIETFHYSDLLDTVIDLYREHPDGTLELLDHVDEEASDLGEYTGIDFPSNGWYQVRVTPYTENTNDLRGTYELSIEIPAADGLTSLIVLGVDDVYSSALPSNATATVEGQGTQNFSGATSVVFNGLTNGTYLVSVPSPQHFMPRQDPEIPYQVTSLTNEFYANPRQVTADGGWRMAGFEMLSTLNISSGCVRDAWTHAFLENAQISFTAASGSLTGTVVDGSVILTSYSTNWLSDAAGQYPDSITLGACNWDLGVTLPGYTPYAQAGAVSNAAAGASLDFGTTYLTPVDVNTNGVSDSWEAAYFPGGMSPTEDSDSDGVNNLHEYYCGTDPTNALSVLRFISGPTGTGTASMVWSTVGGRSYQVMAVTSLVDLATMTTNGPWEASHDQESMEWTDPDASLYNSRFYRIRLANP